MVELSFSSLTQAVLVRSPLLGPIRLVCIDGPAGSGKTTFASRLDQAVRETMHTTSIIHMDDLYEGWSGALEDAGARLFYGVLMPLREGRPGAYAVYDWSRDVWGASRDVPVTDVLIVEGCGSASRLVDGVAVLRVWIDVPPDLRLVRGVERDGPAVLPEWRRWMTHEGAHFVREDTKRRSDIRVDGNAGRDGTFLVR